jgi:GNAT superfamily N-acetyltransferase
MKRNAGIGLFTTPLKLENVMTVRFIIRPSVPEDAEGVGRLAHALECELWPDQAATLDETRFTTAARRLLNSDSGLWAFVACVGNGPMVGMLTVNECMALYAGGPFGEIAEVYITPDSRSAGIGGRLVDAAAAFGRRRSWPFMEVGAPAQPRWKRTVAFYHRQGFRDIGPRLELAL